MSELAVSPTVKKREIAYALWVVGPDSNPVSSATRRRDLTLSWLRFGYQGRVYESSSLRRILDQALADGCAACFVQTPGNVISEDWMLPHWHTEDFHQNLERYFEHSNSLVSADILRVGEFYALDPACMLIDLDRYKALGRPNFGSPNEASRQKLIKPKCVEHKDRTRYLDATNDIAHIVPRGRGWEFINVSLQHGLTVSALPKELAEKRVEIPLDAFSESLATNQRCDVLDTRQKRFLTGVHTQIHEGRRGVFLWNIESYDDVVANRSTTSNPAISHLFCVAAGFKPNMLLNRHGYQPSTEITFFDYSQRALDIRKTLLEEWDGSNYPDFCRHLMQRFPANETFYQLWNGLHTSEIDWADVDQLWEAELNRWGGAKAFQRQWQSQQDLKAHFIHCDVVNDPSPIVRALTNTSDVVIWWSNAFFTIASNWLLSIEQRRARFNRWITQLALVSPDCWLYGADHNNAPVNNITAATYLTQLTEYGISTPSDELIPNQLAARRLRF